MPKEFLQAQEILRRCFKNQTDRLNATEQFTVQDYFNAVFDETKDALRVSTGGPGGSSWKEPVATVADLPTDENHGTVHLVLDDGAGNAALYWYDEPNLTWHKLTSGGGGVAVKDEGGTVVSSASILNFIGTQVQAVDAGGGVANIFVPSAQMASHFNTSDGVASAVMANITTTQRYVADPVAEGNPYKVGSWLGQNVLRGVISSGNISYTTVNACSFYDNTTTTLEAKILDANGGTVLATHLTPAITGNYNAVVNGITIQITGFGADIMRYKGVVTVAFDVAAALPNGGRFSVSITQHNGADGDRTKTQNDIFLDRNPTAQVVTTVTMGETAGNVQSKSVSGVKAYTTGSKFTFGMSGVNWLNADSFPNEFLQFSAPDYGFAQVGFTQASSELSGWTRRRDNTGAAITKSDVTVATANSFIRVSDAKAQGRAVDWTTGAWVQSAGANILIDTYIDDATRVTEDFQGESLRLMPDLITPWDSTQSLTTYAGGNGLQVGDGTYLMYPMVNYTIYNPNPGSQFNYSLAAGTRFYYRRMWHVGTSHSNGLFNISGVTEADLAAGRFKVEISLDGVAWFNACAEYMGGALADGSGCRVNSDSQTIPNLEFTLGPGVFTDASTGGGWGVFIRISMPVGSTARMDGISITNW